MGQVAALLAAVAFVLLVLLLAVPLLKLGRTLDEATVAIRKTHEAHGAHGAHEGPDPDEAGTALTAVDVPRERVDPTIVGAPAVAAGARAPSTVVTTTLGGPLVKVAALSYGLRKATQARIRADAARPSAGSAESRRSRRARR